jgi:hypothetical protein
MPFVVDFSTGGDLAGQNMGAFSQAFSGAIQKQALVDADVARNEAYAAAQHFKTQQQELQNKKASQLAQFSAEWAGPDIGFVPSSPGRGVDAQGNISPIDEVRRRKLSALMRIADGLPAEMLPQYLAVKEREFQEEIVQAQRERMQDELTNLAGRLANTPYGLDQIYGPELQSAIESLEDPMSDPRAAEEIFQRIGSIVREETVKQQQFNAAQNLIGTMIEESANQGGRVDEFADIYGRLLNGELNPEEARSAAIRQRYGLGPETFTIPGTSHKFDLHSNLMRGGKRPIDSPAFDQAAAAEAWMIGVAMAQQDPSLDELASREELWGLASDYAMAVIKSGGWRVPEGYRITNAGVQAPDAAGGGGAGALRRIQQRIQSGELRSRDEVRAALEEAGLDPDQQPIEEGGLALPAQQGGPGTTKYGYGHDILPHGQIQAGATPPPAAGGPDTGPPPVDVRAMFAENERWAERRAEVQEQIGGLDYNRMIGLAKTLGMTARDYSPPTTFSPYADPGSNWQGEKPLQRDPTVEQVIGFLESKHASLPEEQKRGEFGSRLVETVLAMRSNQPRLERLREVRQEFLKVSHLGYAGEEDPAAMMAWLQAEIERLAPAPKGDAPAPLKLTREQRARLRQMQARLKALEKLQ